MLDFPPEETTPNLQTTASSRCIGLAEDLTIDTQYFMENANTLGDVNLRSVIFAVRTQSIESISGTLHFN